MRHDSVIDTLQVSVLGSWYMEKGTQNAASTSRYSLRCYPQKLVEARYILRSQFVLPVQLQPDEEENPENIGSE